MNDSHSGYYLFFLNNQNWKLCIICYHHRIDLHIMCPERHWERKTFGSLFIYLFNNLSISCVVAGIVFVKY